MNLNEIINYFNDEFIPRLEIDNYTIVAKLVDEDIDFDIFESDILVELDDVSEKIVAIVDEVINCFEKMQQKN